MTDHNRHAPIRPQVTPALLRQQRNTALALVMAFVSVLLLVQLWLLVQAIEGAPKGESTIVFPATLTSGLCFLGAWRLWHLLQNRQ
ncbi:MAG TPA: DUF6755 family protein [Candidatus Binatia bacterium]|jgi:hypothetical protein|nr:DUF6755 family protein [Candidatus Binatia bacterium]